MMGFPLSLRCRTLNIASINALLLMLNSWVRSMVFVCSLERIRRARSTYSPAAGAFLPRLSLLFVVSIHDSWPPWWQHVIQINGIACLWGVEREGERERGQRTSEPAVDVMFGIRDPGLSMLFRGKCSTMASSAAGTGCLACRKVNFVQLSGKRVRV